MSGAANRPARLPHGPVTVTSTPAAGSEPRRGSPVPRASARPACRCYVRPVHWPTAPSWRCRRDYYDLLQVPKGASEAQIKRAYRKVRGEARAGGGRRYGRAPGSLGWRQAAGRQ